MEHRLIYFGLNDNPPERFGMNESSVDLRETVERNTMEKREGLAMQAEAPILNKAITLIQGPNLEYHMNQYMVKDMPAQLNGVTESYKAVLTDAGKKLEEGLSDMPEYNEKIQSVISTLSTPLPEHEQGIQSENPYVSIKAGKKGNDWYNINFKKIEMDKKMIADLKLTKPNLAGELQYIENALDEYARQDPKLPLYQWEQEKSGNKMDADIMKMGRLTVALIATAAFVVTGIIALKNRRGFTAPLIYGAVAILAIPGMGQRLLGGKHEKMLSQIKSTVHNPQFNEMAEAYNAKGPSWKNYVSHIMEDNDDAKVLMGKIKDKTITPEEIDAYVKQEMPNDEAAQKSLKKMIDEGKFTTFAGVMMSATDENAQTLIKDYIGEGASAFAKLEKAGTEDARKISESDAAAYPNGGTLGLSR
jgi:hypothetical protein